MFTSKQRMIMTTWASLKEVICAKENIYKEACKPLTRERFHGNFFLFGPHAEFPAGLGVS